MVVFFRLFLNASPIWYKEKRQYIEQKFEVQAIMRKTGVQFHITMKEMAAFLEEIIKMNELKFYGYIYFSEHQIVELDTFSQEEIKKYNEIWISREEKDLLLSKKDILLGRIGDLCIQLGKDDGEILGESSMGAVAEEEIDLLWKRLISRLKRKLLKGAYVVTPSGIKEYYPNLRYSVGAKEAYDNGVIIKPIAGWCHFELVEKE